MSVFEKRIPNEVEAVKLINPIYNIHGKILADAGEWVITDGEYQFYMKDEDFNREFIKKESQNEVVTITNNQWYPIYIEKEVIREVPCPEPRRPWPPWWVPGDPWRPWMPGDPYVPTIWCTNDGYLASHT